jgi:tRNA pseudouridine13 synthase
MRAGQDPLVELPLHAPELVRDFLLPGEPQRAELRAYDEDFVVEELPLYEASGEGDHHYLFIEKKGIPTHEAVRRLARHLGRRDRDFGVAGLKDARAVTRQWMSLEHLDVERLDAFEDESIKLLTRTRHRNKLRRGHLRGNRFEIRLRGTDPGLAERARAVLDLLEREGSPNIYGLQRFGHRFNSHKLGRALLLRDRATFFAELLGRPQASESSRISEARTQYDLGDLQQASRLWPPSFQAERAATRSLLDHPEDEERAIRAIPRRFRTLYLEAFQAQLFNAYLRERRRCGAAVLQGEVLMLERNGAAFVTEDAATEGLRHERFELSRSGPMFGPGLLRPSADSQPFVIEQALLERHQLSLESFAGEHGLRGQRRPLRTRVRGVVVDEVDGCVRLRFELPRGCYATTLIEEILHRPLR